MSRGRKTKPLPLRELEAEARKAAAVVGSHIPDGVGFMLLMFNFTDRPDDPDNFATYVSNAERGTMIETLQEMLDKLRSGDAPAAPVKVETRPRTKWRFR